MAYQSEIEKLEARFREKPEQWFAALADAYRKSGDVEMALEVLNAWIEKRPNYSSGNIVLGRCLLEQGKYDDAVVAFDRVLALDMENILALKSMGEIAEKRGDIDGAREWLNKLLEADPMNEEAQQALEQLGQGGGEPEPAAKTEPEAAEAKSAEAGIQELEAEPEPAVAEAAAVADSPAEPPEVDEGSEDLAALAEQETVPFEASPPPAEFEAPPPVTEEQAAAAVQPGDATVPDLEPMEFAGAGGDEPAQLEGLESTGLDETLVETPAMEPEKTVTEMPATAQAADAPDTRADLEETLIEAPRPDVGSGADDEVPAVTAGHSVSGDDVEFVEQSADEPEAPAPEAADATAEMERPELPIILPEEVEPDLDEPVLEEPEVREPEPVVTETMAELYVSQGLFAEAVDIYEQLLARDPEDTRLEKRLTELREKADGEHAQVSSSSRDRYASSKTGGLSVRELFADLAAGPVTGAAPAATGSQPDVAVEEQQAPGAPKAAGGAFSFDQYFGAGGEQSEAPAEPVAKEPDPGSEGSGQQGQAGDFQDWLKGLKS
jgi:tetratricopeptide (TPR) repeat protein